MDYRDAKINFTVYTTRESYDEIFDEIFDEIHNIPRDLPPEEITSLIQQKITLSLLWVQTMDKKSLESCPIHRVRVKKPGEIIDEENIAEFYYHPNPSMGRANIAGQHVFYASADANTPFHEKTKEIVLGKSIVYSSQWEIKNCPEGVHMRSLFYGLTDIEEKDYSSIMASGLNEQAKKYFDQFPENVRDQFSYCQKRYTDLFTVDGEEHYHLSSAIAYNTFVSALKQKADVPIITYPSVAKDKRAVNFAFRKDFADKYLHLKQIDKLIVTELKDGAVRCTPISRGFVKDGKIEWRTLNVKVEKIHFEEAIICTETQGRRLQSGEGLTNCCAKHKISLEEFMKRNKITDDVLVEGISEIPEELMNSGLSVSQKMNLIVETKGDIFAEQDIAEDKKLKQIQIPITYAIGYELN